MVVVAVVEEVQALRSVVGAMAVGVEEVVEPLFPVACKEA